MYFIDSEKRIWKIGRDDQPKLYMDNYDPEVESENCIVLKNGKTLLNKINGYFCDNSYETYAIYDGKNEIDTGIDVETYVIFDITYHYKNGDSHTCVYYIARTGETPIRVHSKLLIGDENCIVLNNTRSVAVDGHAYEHIAGNCIRTDSGIFQLHKNEQAIPCDAIFENIFSPVVQRGNNFYIGYICITGLDFFRQSPIKSAC